MSASEKVTSVVPPAPTAPKYGALTNGYGTSVEVERMAAKPTGGSKASQSLTSDGWKKLIARRNDRTGSSSYYVKGHLLNNHLGGPGDTWDNLTPLTQEGNNRSGDSMYYAFEKKVKAALFDDKREVTAFKVVAQYGAPSRQAEIAEIDTELKAPTISKAETTRLQVIKNTITEEQNIAINVQCTATLGKGKKHTSSELLNVPVVNSFRTVSWRNYKART